MDRKIEFKYQCSISGDLFEISSFDFLDDFDLVYQWMQQPHVALTWNLNQSVTQLKEYLQTALSKDSQQLWLISINHKLAGYAETYYAPFDRLADYYPVVEGDYGIHLLIGETSMLGKNYSRLIIRGLCDYLFVQKQAKRVLIEPSIEVKALNQLDKKLGFTKLAVLNFPEKIANLFAIEHREFYIANSAPISLDYSNWPLVRIHFPSYPSDYQVKLWLEKLDKLIALKEHFVVVSTFDRHYQFSQAARKLEMQWFKKNKEELGHLCLGFLRVTTDEDMIKKLANPAMSRGIPFHCIPHNSLQEALSYANLLITRQSLTSVRAS